MDVLRRPGIEPRAQARRLRLVGAPPLVGADHTRSAATMGRWLALLFASGATLSVAGFAVPHVYQPNAGAIVALGLSAYPIAAIVWVLGRHLPAWAFHVLLGAGAAIVTLGVYYAEGPYAPLVGVFYVWVALYAFLFFRTAAAVAHLVVVGAAYGAVLALDGVSGAPALWLVMMGSVLTAGVVVGRLAHAIRALAATDPLTGAANRRQFEERLALELSRAARRGQPVSVAVLDLDDFKDTNDRLGHKAGDLLLVEAVTAWRGALRDVDSLARYGGDEFVVVLPECSLPEGQEVVQRLAGACERAPFSAGLALWNGEETADRLVDRADAALYRAKRNGRGHCVADFCAASSS